MTNRIALICILLALNGCSETNYSDLEEFVNKAPNAVTTGKSKKDLLNHRVIPVFNYTGFNPFLMQRKNQSITTHGLNEPDLERERDSLEQYTIDNISMIGYLKKGNNSFAILLAPDNKLYNAQVGSYIGQNFGQILQITEDGMQIEELYQEQNGDWEKRNIALKLKKPNEE